MPRNSYEELKYRLLGVDGVEINGNDRRSGRSWLRENAFRLTIVSLLVYIAVAVTGRVAPEHANWGSPGATASVSEDKEYSFVPKEHLQYTQRPEWESLQHPWNLNPSDELDAAWENMLYALNIRVTANELHLAGENLTNRVQVDGGDYVAVIGVFHHIHCLNSLRRLINWDYYGPRLAKAKGFHAEAYTPEHSKHCIDTIRQALMCHANTAIYTGEWLDDAAVPISPHLRTGSVAHCVNWDVMDGWARQRALVPGRFRYLPGPYKYNVLEDQE